MFDMGKWWSLLNPRVPLPGRLTDYAATIERYNRSLFFKVTPSGGGAGFTVKPNTNRVAVAAGFDASIATGAMLGQILFQTAASVTILTHGFLAKEADVAAVTPSPIVYNPFFADSVVWGPIIQQQIALNLFNVTSAYLLEVLLNPNLDGSPTPM